MIADPLARQFRSNALHWLEANGFPDVITFREQSDRCLILCGGAFAARCDEVMERWDKGIKAHQPLGYETAVRGWRERRARWAVQIIEHHSDDRFFEMDFDASNPGWGLGLMALHGICDWLWQRVRKHKTDPRVVARKRGWPLVESEVA